MRIAILGIFLGLCVAAAPVTALQLQKVSLDDLTLLAQSDLSDQTTLVFLESREIGFELDAETIILLREKGVSDEVIEYLLEKSARPSDSDGGVVYISVNTYPFWYYGFYYSHHYGHGAYPYFGHTILAHWTHGHHWRGDHSISGGHHRSIVGHSASDSRRQHASDSHSGESHDTSSHLTALHGGKNHSSTSHSGGQHSSRRHSVSGHRAGRGGGHARGHSRGHSRGHRGGHSGGHGRSRGGGGH